MDSLLNIPESLRVRSRKFESDVWRSLSGNVTAEKDFRSHNSVKLGLFVHLVIKEKQSSVLIPKV